MASRGKEVWETGDPDPEGSPVTPDDDQAIEEPLDGEAAEPVEPDAASTSAPGEGLPADELADADRLIAEALGSGEAVSDLAIEAERNQYRDALMRVKADFDNYKKRVANNQQATIERAAEKLVSELLPVLDACEAALGHGSTDVEPIFKSLLDVLEKSGLTRLDAEGQPFDPNLHEAVMHEPGDGGETVVSGSLRTGYLWHGRVVRPAMVKVKG